MRGLQEDLDACHGPCAPHTQCNDEVEAQNLVLSFPPTSRPVLTFVQRARRPPGDLASEVTGHRPEQPHGRKACQSYF